MRFVLTGAGWAHRSQIQGEIERAGHHVRDGFSNGADVLVASRSDTRKAIGAQMLGKPVWTYDQLRSFLASGRQPSTTRQQPASPARPARPASTSVPTADPHPVPAGHTLFGSGKRMIDL